MTLSYLWLRQCALHSIVDAPDTVSSAWLLVTLQPGPLLRHSGQQECVWHLPWSESEGGSRAADQQTSTSPGYSRIQERHTFIVLTKLQRTPKSIWQLPCGFVTGVANVSIYQLYIHFSSCIQPFRSQQPGELLIIGIVQRSGQRGQPRQRHICVWSGPLLPALSLTIMSF